MIHRNKEEFVEILQQAAKQKKFVLPLIEKDYYLTLILSHIHELSEDLIFKGGTCLNKIYFAYYRLSEDLDFSMKLPRYEATRGERRKCIESVKNKIKKFVESLDMKIEDAGNPGRNESKQYVYYLLYPSAIRSLEGRIKLEIGLRFNPFLPAQNLPVQHAFLHPFTGEPLFDGGKVNCLSLKEIVSEKLRAAALRKPIAPRDFYDLDFILRNDFDLTDTEVMDLLKKKVAEDGGSDDLSKYRTNLGRSEDEIKDMRSRIETELFDVLTLDERENFNLDKALKRINKAMSGL